jgi:hypothetical protein
MKANRQVPRSGIEAHRLPMAAGRGHSLVIRRSEAQEVRDLNSQLTVTLIAADEEVRLRPSATAQLRPTGHLRHLGRDSRIPAR